MDIAPEEIETVLKSLADTPHWIASASKGLPAAQLHFNLDQETWSANDILAHLRACADVWGRGILAMLGQDHPRLRYVSPRTWIRKTDYLQQEFGASLLAFTQQRYQLLKVLQVLTYQDWLRGATFTGTTRGREQTVYSYARRIAQHEHEHCEQIEAILKQM